MKISNRGSSLNLRLSIFRVVQTSKHKASPTHRRRGVAWPANAWLWWKFRSLGMWEL